MSGHFFAIGAEEFGQACKLGLNPAVAFLVLARGTGPDNITTRWSAEAVRRCAGIAWKRAGTAIAALEHAGLAKNPTKSGKGRTLPTRKLAFPKDMREAIWLPNTLVDGAGDGPVPIARLRQTQNVEYLQAFVELYALQDLEGDGGLPRNLIRCEKTRTHICDAGQFRVYGFDDKQGNLWVKGPLERFRQETKPAPGDDWPSWKFIKALQSLGLLETVYHLVEGEAPEAELMHAITGDQYAHQTMIAAEDALASLPEWITARQASAGHQFTLPVLRHIEAASVVGVARLKHRPHTEATGRWWEFHKGACAKYTEAYNSIANQNFAGAFAKRQAC